jgi:hypothetical protein
MPPYTAFTAYTSFTAASTVFTASVPKPLISTVRQLNMADTGEIFSDVSSEVDTHSARPSAVETEADVGSVATTQISKLTSSIHKHCRLATKEEKKRTKKTYFCKYCPPQDPKGHHASTVGLQGHLRKHDIEWSTEENNRRTTVRDLGEKSIQDLYEKLLAKGEV